MRLHFFKHASLKSIRRYECQALRQIDPLYAAISKSLFSNAYDAIWKDDMIDRGIVVKRLFTYTV